MNVQGLDAGSVYLNGFRQRFIRAQARQLVRQFARLVQWRQRRQLTSLEFLPIDPRAVAAEVLGLAVEEIEEIGFAPVGGHLQVDIAGVADREEKKIIIARRGFKPATRRFTIAHEIGHLNLHREQRAFRDSPRTDAEIRSSRRSLREREADLFAAELLMPEKAVREVFARLFPSPIDEGGLSDDVAFLLSDGKLYASEIRRMKRLERAELVAQSSFFTFTNSRSLADIFAVSPVAMAIQLLDLGLSPFSGDE